MNSPTLLVMILIGQGVLLTGTLLVFFGHGVWLYWGHLRNRPRLIKARTLMVTALAGTPLPSVDRAWLQALSIRLQVRLFAEMAPSLRGGQRRRLSVLARDIGLVTRAMARCRSRWWWQRLQGVRLLTLVGGGVEAVYPLLGDDYAIIRAQAAEWAADHPSPASIEALLALLGDPHGLCRFAAQNALMGLGNIVIPPLASVLTSSTGHQAEAALEVAVGLAESRFLEPALAFCQDTSPRMRALAAILLGALGGREGVEMLSGLLVDTAPEVRAAAAQALGRLGYWPAVSLLAPLLRDQVWVVRREAGLALRALGAPGILFLRRYLADQDSFAADMARQVLDLPDTSQLSVAL